MLECTFPCVISAGSPTDTHHSPNLLFPFLVDMLIWVVSELSLSHSLLALSVHYKSNWLNSKCEWKDAHPCIGSLLGQHFVPVYERKRSEVPWKFSTNRQKGQNPVSAMRHRGCKPAMASKECYLFLLFIILSRLWSVPSLFASLSLFSFEKRVLNRDNVIHRPVCYKIKTFQTDRALRTSFVSFQLNSNSQTFCCFSF